MEVDMGRLIKYPVVDGKKECGDCGEWLPIEEYKKARNHFTSRCKKCLSIYAAKYRANPENKVKHSEYHRQYMADMENKKRTNKRNAIRNKRPDVKEYKNMKRREWSAVQKQKAVDYKGGACILCGYNKCLSAMDFHHMNPSEKEGIKSHWTFEKNKAELDKCILVCNRCHKEIHAGVVTI